MGSTDHKGGAWSSTSHAERRSGRRLVARQTPTGRRERPSWASSSTPRVRSGRSFERTNLMRTTTGDETGTNDRPSSEGSSVRFSSQSRASSYAPAKASLHRHTSRASIRPQDASVRSYL